MENKKQVTQMENITQGCWKGKQIDQMENITEISSGEELLEVLLTLNDKYEYKRPRNQRICVNNIFELSLPQIHVILHIIKYKVIKYVELDNERILIEYADDQQQLQHDDYKMESSPFIRNALEEIFQSAETMIYRYDSRFVYSHLKHSVLGVISALSDILKAKLDEVPELNESLKLKIGRIDFTDFKICKQIGRGGFGIVYKVLWHRSVMAVKICSQTETHKFEREARQMSRTGHKNIVRLFGSCFKGDCGYLVMDYEECGSLYEYLHDREQREYTMAMAIDWMIQCIQGINHMHSMKPRPLIHRDLKTANLLLSQNYKNLKIGDFGISTDLRTMMSGLAGTAGYTAPEVLGGKKYTEKCDIYSFGIVLWEVMARRKPFHHLENQTAWAKIFATDRGERPILKDIIPNCEKLQRLIENCWDQEPKNRPAGTQIELKDIPCLDIIMRP